MGANSKIEWCDHTFNPWWGCQRVSPGCEHCYAEAFDKRMGGDHWGPAATRKIASDAYWKQPHAWNRKAATGIRTRVFCASMADVFEDRPELAAPRGRLWQLISDTPHLEWLLLTKRPENADRLWARATQRVTAQVWAGNVWLGVTVEDQQRADERIPHLLCAPAEHRFLSCEPLLGPINLDRWCFKRRGVIDDLIFGSAIDWVIVGGESGSDARPMRPEWARAIRDQCANAGTPFFFKQWGEWATRGNILARVGKRSAGHTLDGVVWQQLP